MSWVKTAFSKILAAKSRKNMCLKSDLALEIGTTFAYFKSIGKVFWRIDALKKN